MNTEAQIKTDYQCQHCEKAFMKESTLAVHLCAQKRRFLEQNEVGVQLGLQAYLRFYELTQGSAKLKTFKDFSGSPYYTAFVKFGRYCVSIRAVNTPRFIEWVVKQNKKIDHWCHDKVYTEYLQQYLRDENIQDALARAIEHALTWSEETEYPSHDYLRHANANAVCFAISSGRISPWVLYNSAAGNELLDRLNPEQVSMIWSIIDTDFWSKKFQDYSADTEYTKEILKKAGW